MTTESAHDHDDDCPMNPDREWVELGYVDTNVATIAIVNPLFAKGLSDHWQAYIAQLTDETIIQHFEEVTLETEWHRPGVTGPGAGPFLDKSPAVIFRTPDNGCYKVEGRFADIYDTGHLSLTELRIVLWDPEPDDEAR